MMESDNKPRCRLEDCVVAAIETGARLRGPETGKNSARGDPIERTIAMIDRRPPEGATACNRSAEWWKN